MFYEVMPGPPAFFYLMFAVVLSLFAYTIISSIAEWSRNQASEVHMRNVRVVAKRTRVHRRITTYYATFEFLDDGSRLELRIPARPFGLMAKGDLGILNYQGTQFNAFERTRNEEVFL